MIVILRVEGKDLLTSVASLVKFGQRELLNSKIQSKVHFYVIC